MSLNIYLVADHPEFINQIAHWYQLQWGEKYPEKTLSDWVKTIFISRLTPTTFVAIDESTKSRRLVGTVALHKQGMDDSDPESIWLTALYVNESDRHKGIGTKLLQAASAHAQQVDISKLYLFTFTSGEIYTKQGWYITSETNIHGKRAIIMEKAILPFAG